MNSIYAEIYFAGGCFWGVQAYMSRLAGVTATDVGYANGATESPTYEDVCHKNTGHAETVHVVYNPSLISLRELLVHFFRIIDPTTLNKQAGDIGTQYRSGIYYTDENDKAVIEAMLNEVQVKYAEPIVTEVMPLENYYKGEEYHQYYLVKNPCGYCHVNLDMLEDQHE